MEAKDLMKEHHIILPETIDTWSLINSQDVIDSDNIFNYMNGAGEIYLGYRFKKLHVFNYISDIQKNILVEIYFMQTSDDAFGLLSMDWEGDSDTLKNVVLENNSNASFFSDTTSLYGMGLLRLRSGNIYARVMAHVETQESRKAVLQIGRKIVEAGKKSLSPQILTMLPERAVSKWEMQRDRLCFLRSYLVLNTVYYISHENILNLDHTNEALIVPFERISNSNIRERCQVLLVKYATREKARKALQHFCKTFLSKNENENMNNGDTGDSKFLKIEDGWLGYQLSGRHFVIIFDSPDRASAQNILRQINPLT